MKTVCVYHSIDLDGWMSAAIVKHWYLSKVIPNGESIGELILEPTLQEYVPKKPIFKDTQNIWFLGYNYGQPIPNLSGYDNVIMCDISFPVEEMNLLGNNLIWVDHHISAITACETNNEQGISGLRRIDFSACELTWKYFFPEPDGADYHTAHIPSNLKGENIPLPKNKMPEIVRLLGMYDSLRHKGTDEEQKVLEFQYGARGVISNYEEAYNYLIDNLNPTSGIVEDVLYNGGAIYQYLCTEAKQAYKNGFEIELGQSSVKLVDLATIPDTEPETLKNAVGTFLPYKFICINKERFNPINFGIDYHKDGYDGAACFWYADNKWHFSLYNDNDQVDCSAIAKQYGGGGHKGAAGFVVDDINKIIKLYE
jgi:hypothetical protein